MAVKELSFSKNNESEENAGTAGTVIEINDTKITSDKGERGVWINNNSVPIDLPVSCKVSQKILIIMRSIEFLMKKTNMNSYEFAIYVSGEFSSNKLVVKDDFFIPDQTVSAAAIDFNEEDNFSDDCLKGVIHRHPSGCASFSGTDKKYINSNFDFSLLYVNNNITSGIFNIKIGNNRIQVPLKIDVLYPIYEIDRNSVLSKIHKSEISSSVSKSEREDPRSIYNRMLPSENMGGLTGLSRFNELMDRRNSDLIGFDELPGLGDGTAFGKDDNGADGNDDTDDTDEDAEILYQCKHCGEIQFFTSFPVQCESCEKLLYNSDVTEVNDTEEIP